MKTRNVVSRLLLAATALGSASIGVVAQAQQLRVGPIVTPAPTSAPSLVFLPIYTCTNPSAATCNDPKLYTQTYASGSCGALEVAACGPRLQTAYKAGYPTLGAPRTELDAKDDVTLRPADNGSAGARGRFGAYSGSLAVMSNTDPTFEGSHLTNLIQLTSTSYPTSLRAYVRPIGYTWAADGNTLSSCPEYAYKRFWDYERFRDDALTCRGDTRCIYDATYGVSPHASPIANRTLMERNGKTPLDSQIELRTGVFPKNAFFDVPLAALAVPSDPSMATALADITANLNNKSASAYYAIGYANNARENFANEWAFWKAMHDRSISTTSDAQFEDQQRRMAAFRQVVESYGATDWAVHNGSIAGSNLPWQPFDPGTVESQDALDWGNTYKSMATNLVKIGALKTTDFPGMVLTGAANGGGTVMGGGASAGAGAAAKHAMATGGVMPGALDAATAMLQRAIVAEWNRPDSCLHMSNYACDWSPSDFAQHMMNQYKPGVEAAYDDCMDIATTSFSVADNQATAPAPTSDVPNLKKWIDVTRTQYLTQLASVPRYPGAPVGAIGMHRQASNSLGDKSVFAATLDYDFGWLVQKAAVKKGTNDTCAFTGSFTGKLDVDGWVFGNDISVLHSDSEASIDPVTAKKMTFSTSTQLFGETLYAPPAQSGPSNAQWNMPLMSGANSVLDMTYPFMVVVVPVTVSASAVLSYGVNLDANVGATDACTDHSPLGPNGKPQPKFGGDVTLTPYANLDAVATVGCGIPGFFDVGVKGTVAIAHVSVPVTNAVDIVSDSASTTGLGLQFKTQGDLHLSELSGSVSAYVQALLWEYDAQLFAWDGFHQDPNLWSSNTTIDINAFQVANQIPVVQQ